MHRYLRAVGFSKVHKREEFDALAQFTAECYQSEETTVTADGEEFAERRKAFADQMGILTRGVYDDQDQYHMDYCIPYFSGKTERFYEDMNIERLAEKEAYCGVCDDMNLGV